MSFKDQSATSVKSLLALLRTTQDQDTPTPSTPTPPSSQRAPTLTHRSTPPKAVTVQVPSQQQINNLLASLQSSQPPLSQPNTSEYIPTTQNLSTPYNLVQASSSSSNQVDQPSSHTSTTNARSEPSKKGEPGFEIMPFSKALPIISNLLEDTGFVQELKRMRADQDALERRLWAKQEKVKADHEKAIQAEKDIAKITRRPIPQNKQDQWAQTLILSLDDYYRQHCLPAIDGLAFRQKQRLEEMGVPGLGGEVGDERARLRVKRIMDVLQGGLED